MKGVNVPEILGCMILSDCILFPHGAMPLNIFEPRYREMLSDAIEGDCVFGIVNESTDPKGNPSPANIGTVGLVRASKQKEDGTSQLILHGFLRMKVIEWVNDRSYPRARISPITFDLESSDTDQLSVKVQKLRKMIIRALEHTDTEIKTHIIDMLDQADHPHIFADLVSQQFVQDPKTRQFLLETNDAGRRLDILSHLLGAT